MFTITEDHRDSSLILSHLTMFIGCLVFCFLFFSFSIISYELQENEKKDKKARAHIPLTPILRVISTTFHLTVSQSHSTTLCLLSGNAMRADGAKRLCRLILF